MSRGIYITANDKVIEQGIALLKSIRKYDSDTPIILIPYDDNYQTVAERFSRDYGVKIYQDLKLIKRLSNKLKQIFGNKFFARPNQFHKQACWFGEFDEFLYIDTDIVVFDKIIDNLNYLNECDFLCFDYQHLGGIKNVFTPEIYQVFSQDEVKDIFNGGWWASKKGLISEQYLYDIFAECATHPEYFDFSQKTSDQPIINYMILKSIKRRFNIVRRPGKAPGSWAGTSHFHREGDKLMDGTVNKPLEYLHWAGFRIEPGCPYWDIWEHYRYLGEAKPTYYPQKTERKKSLGQRIWNKVKKSINF
ncbi:MAG: methionine synthase [Okeania sp. SIO2C2]|uniref:Npun_R2821/Npun_R2822 family protein n=1 Tax=Okeania sp. SIO2C2 TaxID=2607787 RepID=UPI0013BC4ACB|nr:Npun_R2821/Npun_R2822 family protein [Okeania sp. SIO2C2]NEP90616.1 methionine synthase [Okeania sp. SIO2C2]